MAFQVTFRKGRTSDDTVTLYESDGTTSITLAGSDVVRFKAYKRDAATPVLDIDSAADSANSSGITVDETGPDPVASVTLRVAQGDTSSLDPGVYRAEIDVVDDSETAPADAIKHAESGICVILGSGGGDVGTS